MTLLTQEQVDALPTGTKVRIKWSGGNGPAIYTIDSFWGKAYTEFDHRIDFVGDKPPFTMVELVQ